MAYITKSNSKRILKKINLNEIGKLEAKFTRDRYTFLVSGKKKTFY